ncbi:NusG domain II-containing protein [Fundicoccus culcitae]|uniref:NusG domain II-containing protein n=1 Tax=Fundicoccus culcitae TaxID=2969821 RepID=A0ABY5P5C2_9LACT|nr:NusG domain II-containing protein [Fundicoccus culcitae]UUX33952.1 NusG domain II-containing protein [Fundicoccus culcitae]
MRSVLKQMKPFDYIIIVLCIFISFLPNIVTAAIYSKNTDEHAIVALIKINGQEVDRFVLGEDTEDFEKTYYPNTGQYNIIQKQGDQIRIKEDNSPDQIGVRTGWIQNPGQTAICLPHGLVIEIQGEMEEDPLILPL